MAQDNSSTSKSVPKQKQRASYHARASVARRTVQHMPSKRMGVFESKKPSGVTPASSRRRYTLADIRTAFQTAAKQAKPSIAWHWCLIGALSVLLVVLLLLLGYVRFGFGRSLLNRSDSSGLLAAASVSTDGAQSAARTDDFLSRGSSSTAASSRLSIRIFNGWTIADIDKALAARRLAEEGDFIEAASRTARERSLPFAEGFFLAGDYSVTRGDGFAAELSVLMADAFMEAAQPLFGYIFASGMRLSDFAIIASMISAETKNEEEFPMISSIIHNRLASDMPLGIDATTRYETGDWENPISQQVLDKITPYNTRRKAGLPPTGICCPSAETLKAAIRPASTDYYYYRHDGNGQIHYSRTYEEHLDAARQYP